jgi:adenylate cyclase
MNAMTHELEAWLESPEGERYPIPHNCSIGRSRDNQLVLEDMRVSRRHALIRLQGPGEYWIVDFGTVNGTRVDGRRIAVPSRLHDGARVELGGMPFTFRHPGGTLGRRRDPAATQATLGALRRLPVWLLIVDIIDSSTFYRRLDPDQLPHAIGSWFATCREILESTGGTINQYLGDGFFGHWPDGDGVPAKVAGALDRLVGLQEAGSPDFRWVLHHGVVTVTGTITRGEENLMGSDMHFLFRMESVSKSMGRTALISAAAARRLPETCCLVGAGQCRVKGLEGEHAFYAWPSDLEASSSSGLGGSGDA